MARDYVNAPKKWNFHEMSIPQAQRARVEFKESSITVTVFSNSMMKYYLGPSSRLRAKLKVHNPNFAKKHVSHSPSSSSFSPCKYHKKTWCSRFQDVVRHQHCAVGCQGCFMEKDLDIFQKTRATLIEEDHVKMTRKTGLRPPPNQARLARWEWNLSAILKFPTLDAHEVPKLSKYKLFVHLYIYFSCFCMFLSPSSLLD